MTDVQPLTERETTQPKTAKEPTPARRSDSGMTDPLADPLTDPLLQNQAVMFYGGGSPPAGGDEPQGELEAVGERPILAPVGRGVKGADSRGNLKIDAAIISQAADMVAGLHTTRPAAGPLFQPIIASLEERSGAEQKAMESHIYNGKADLLNKGPEGLIDMAASGTPGYEQKTGRIQNRLESVEGQIKDVRGLQTRTDMAMCLAHSATINYQSLVTYLKGLDPGTGEFQVLVDAVETAGKPGVARVGEGGAMEIARQPEGPKTHHEVNAEEMDAVMRDVEQTAEGNGKSYPTMGVSRDPLPSCLEQVDVAMDRVMNEHGALMGVLSKARSAAILAKSKADKEELEKHNKNVAAISKALDEATSIVTTIEGAPARAAELLEKGPGMSVAGSVVQGMLDLSKDNLSRLEASVGAAEAAASAAQAGGEVREARARIGAFRTALDALEAQLREMMVRVSEFRQTSLEQGKNMDTWMKEQAPATGLGGAAGSGGAAGVETENMRWKMLALARVSESVQLLDHASGKLQEVAKMLRDAGLPAEEQRALEVLASDLLGATAGEMTRLSTPLRAVAGRFQKLTRTAGGAAPEPGN